MIIYRQDKSMTWKQASRFIDNAGSEYGSLQLGLQLILTCSFGAIAHKSQYKRVPANRGTEEGIYA